MSLYDNEPYNYRGYNYYYRSLLQEVCPNQESETGMNIIDHKPTIIETSNVAEEPLVFVISIIYPLHQHRLRNNNREYISPESDTHDHELVICLI